ncbi:MAG: hypothetical protein ACRC7O_03715, partial [Fimbriiglobus sp.]
MNRRVVQIARVNPPELVRAEVVRDIPSERLRDIEAAWRPSRRALPGVEHGHWDWRNKLDPVAAGLLRVIALEQSGRVEGLMAVATTPRESVLDGRRRGVLYIDFLESAPWNLPSTDQLPVFTGVGRALMVEAVLLSFEVMCGGRIGLHSLPQTEGFYATGCGMTRVGPDPNYQFLTRFEYIRVTQLRGSVHYFYRW